jgi:hypothetical protein
LDTERNKGKVERYTRKQKKKRKQIKDGKKDITEHEEVKHE